MPVQNTRYFTQDLDKRVDLRQGGSISNTDNEGVVVYVSLYHGKEEAPVSGSVAGAVVCPDGSTVPLQGSFSGNTVSVALKADCVAIPGEIGLGIQVVDSSTGVKTTVFRCSFTVDVVETNHPVDPGSRTSLQVGDLIAAIDQAIASIPPEYDELVQEISDLKSAFLPLKVYEFIDPNEFRNFVTDHAINAQINNGKFEPINSRICAPYVFRCKNKIKICANVISNVNCFLWVNTYSGPTLDKTITGSWQGPGNYVTIEHDTYFAFQVRKSGSGTAISPSEMSDAITVAMVNYHMVTDKTLLLENVPADAKTTGQQISGNTSNIANNTMEIGNLKNYTVNNLSKTFDVYELDNAEAIYQFFEDNIILGAFNDYGEVDTTSTIRAVLPIVFKTKNQVKLSTTGGYQFNRNVIENQIVPYSSRTVSGWQTTLIFNPDTYYNLTFRNGSSGATVVLADLMNAIDITVTDYTVTERFAVAMANNYHPIKSVAHRGRMDVAPENTMPAFIAAVKAGFKYIETDVLFTQDGTPVCIHDPTVNRTSNGEGSVSAMTYNQLLSYDFGNWFGSQFAGTKIPTFEEYIAFCHNTGTIPIIELKTNEPVMTNAQIDQLIAIVKKYGLEDAAYWSSFGNGFLQYIYTNHPTYHLLYGIGWKSDEVSIAYIKERYPSAIAQFASAPTAERLALYKAENIPACVWAASDISAITALDPYISMVFNNLYHVGATMLMNAVK